MEKIKVLSVFGTRPEAIKMAPLVKELEERPEFESFVCATAQHREMLDSVLEMFNITPDFDLNIMESGQSLSGITTKILASLGEVLRRVNPDICLVHGDTTTTFSSALAAFYEKIAVGHVEAGLRTYDKYSPFPEEMNRLLVSRIAELHFSPTAQNAENLRRENVTGEIFVTGNTAIDAMRHTLGRSHSFHNNTLADLDFTLGRTIVLTCHRRENYGTPMENIFTSVLRIARDFPDVRFVYPVHLSAEVTKTAGRILAGNPGIILTEPLDAFDMHALLAKCHMVMTDSGGLQEEAPALNKPVLVLRRETERPEAISAGTAVLAGIDADHIYNIAAKLLTNDTEYANMANSKNPYGDGCASARIADGILWRFGKNPAKPEDF